MKQAGTAATEKAGHRGWLLLLLLSAAPSLLAQQHGGSLRPQAPGRHGSSQSGPAPTQPQGSGSPRSFHNAGNGFGYGPGDAHLQNPREARAPGTPPEAGGRENFRPGPSSGIRPGGGQHLPQWFAQHGGLPVDQQEQALRREPGFERLPPEQQQHLIDRLQRLNLQPPAQRQRMMERNERFEALPPERQQEVRGAGQALGQMPPDRREAVRQAFRDLRNLPVEERANALNSARFQAEYSPQERTVLNNLLSIEPYQPR